MSSADQIIASLQGISAASFLDEPERIRARDALFHALRKVQSPWEIAWDQSWACVASTACVKTLIDAGYCQGNATASFFEYIGADPLRTSDFNDAMECQSKYNSFPWTEVYQSDSIVAAARPGIPLVVDIGGSKGHDLRKFLSRYPDLPLGSLVLEDLPIILKSVDIGDNSASVISVQPHDFFTPQPVVGARAYYMHHILHDWPDDKAIRIMKTLAPAMEKGYSRLLIHESLVSKIRPLSSVTVSDITMMTLVAASERTEERWEELISSAGLRLIKIWRPEHSIEGIIEAEVA